MTTIFLTTTCAAKSYNPRALDNFNRIVHLSERDLVQQHQVIDCPETADLILFICDRRIYHSGIYRSEIFQKYPEKSLVVDFNDRTIPRIPGLYATIPFYLQRYPIYKSLFYPYNHGCFDLAKANALFSDYKYLFSFMGDINTYPSLRSEVLNLIHPRAYLKNTYRDFSPDLFTEISIGSKFILCPRGAAASTIRVFETMRASRVPVIISDEWQENELAGDGNWQDFSVRVLERDVKLIPEILAALESKALTMGQKARSVWEDNFSIDRGFDWLVNSCLKIQKSRTDCAQILSRKIYLEALNKHHFIPFYKESIRGVFGKI
jgi:Exostosin family